MSQNLVIITDATGAVIERKTTEEFIRTTLTDAKKAIDRTLTRTMPRQAGYIGMESAYELLGAASTVLFAVPGGARTPYLDMISDALSCVSDEVERLRAAEAAR